MTRISIQEIKAAFETGDRPNGSDYANLIDSLIQQATDLGSYGNNEHTINGIENETLIDSFTSSEWRMVKYIVSISKTTNGDNKYYATELSILIDGTNVNISQYGIIDNDGDIGTVDVSREDVIENGQTVNKVILSVIPNPAIKPVTVRFARMGLKA